MNLLKRIGFALLALLPVAGIQGIAYADEGMTQALFTANNIWMMVATFLVFIMHLGFATLESGLTRAKNTVNILFKNTSIIAIGMVKILMCLFKFLYKPI